VIRFLVGVVVACVAFWGVVPTLLIGISFPIALYNEWQRKWRAIELQCEEQIESKFMRSHVRFAAMVNDCVERAHRWRMQ
jgi:hypothetical protein